MIRITKYEIGQWIKQNLRIVILSVILAIVSFFLVPLAFLFGLGAVFSKDTMLTALIEAEATILGFFGFIAIYTLTSLDERIDRLEQQIFDIQIRSMTERNQIVFENLPKRIGNISNTKKRTVHSVLYTGFLLFVSLLSSILALGIPADELSFYLCSFSVLLLFGSLSEILWTVYYLSKNPEEPLRKPPYPSKN